MNQTIGGQSDLMQSGGKQVTAAHDPQYWPRMPRRDPGKKQQGCSIIAPFSPCPGSFVQRSKCKPLSCNTGVHGRNAEWQNTAGSASARHRNLFTKQG